MADHHHGWSYQSDAGWLQDSDDTDLLDYTWSFDHYAADNMTDARSTYADSASIILSEAATPAAGSMDNEIQSSLNLIWTNVRCIRSISPIDHFQNMSSSSEFSSPSETEKLFRRSSIDVSPKAREACTSKDTRLHESHHERRREQNRVAQRRFRARKEAKLNSSVDTSRKLQDHVYQLQKQIIDLQTANSQLQQLIESFRET